VCVERGEELAADRWSSSRRVCRIEGSVACEAHSINRASIHISITLKTRKQLQENSQISSISPTPPTFHSHSHFSSTSKQYTMQQLLMRSRSHAGASSLRCRHSSSGAATVVRQRVQQRRRSRLVTAAASAEKDPGQKEAELEDAVEKFMRLQAEKESGGELRAFWSNQHHLPHTSRHWSPKPPLISRHTHHTHHHLLTAAFARTKEINQVLGDDVISEEVRFAPEC